MSKAELVRSPYYKSRDYDDDILITDDGGNQFSIFLGGNGDLYFVPQGQKHLEDGKKIIVHHYLIGKENEYLFDKFDKFLKNAKVANNARYNAVDNECFENDKFFWLSEDSPEDIANKLEITKTDNEIILDIIVNRKSWSQGVRFTLSGCRNFKVVEGLVKMRRQMQAELAIGKKQDISNNLEQ